MYENVFVNCFQPMSLVNGKVLCSHSNGGGSVQMRENFVLRHVGAKWEIIS